VKCFILMSMSQINGIVKGTVVPTPFVARSKEQSIKVLSSKSN